MKTILDQQIKSWEMTLEQDQRALRNCVPEKEREYARKVQCCQDVLKELNFYKSRNYKE